jgi:hypothetical protein
VLCRVTIGKVALAALNRATRMCDDSVVLKYGSYMMPIVSYVAQSSIETDGNPPCEMGSCLTNGRSLPDSALVSCCRTKFATDTPASFSVQQLLYGKAARRKPKSSHSPLQTSSLPSIVCCTVSISGDKARLSILSILCRAAQAGQHGPPDICTKHEHSSAAKSSQ